MLNLIEDIMFVNDEYVEVGNAAKPVRPILWRHLIK
jgi:hypothetical protein